MLGHRGVAVPLDHVDRDAEGGECFGVHVGAGAGAEKDDVLEAGAAGRNSVGTYVWSTIAIGAPPRMTGNSSGFTSGCRFKCNGGSSARCR